jgi:predicted phage terminase large subunit-like protein
MGQSLRCLTYGAPRLGGLTAGYNSYYQIVQTPDYVAIHAEMFHETRIVWLNGRQHLPPTIRQWLGDSRGHWEGNTLVVDVTNFSPKTDFQGSREDLHLVERWTRTDPNTVEYVVTMDDATTWTKPWTVKMELSKQGDQFNRIYKEPRCHEGNFGMLGQWAFHETCRQVLDLRQRYPLTDAILIEDAANGPAIINVLGRQVPGIIGVTPEGGKYARAQAASPSVEAGNVWLPNPRPHGRLLPERAWVDDFIHECCVFPTGAHDDDVDAFSQLVARCVQPELCNFLTW